MVRDIEIKLVNRDGRTVLSFVKRAYCDDDGVCTSDDWDVAVKPRSEKMLMHERPQKTQTPDRYLKQLPDGRRVLQLAGLTLRWGKVTPVLDRLAKKLTWVPRGEHAYGTRTLTVDELREHVGS